MATDISRELICFRLLRNVLVEKGYGAISLSKQLNEIDSESDKAYVSNLFYGTLEKNVQFDYVLSKLTQKKPKPSVGIAIKMGLYMLWYGNTPAYAATDKTVRLVKALGKEGVSGFVNAVLRNASSVTLPKVGEVGNADYLSITYSVPLWIVKELISDYGYETAEEIMKGEAEKRVHIRNNGRVITKEGLKKKLNGEYESTRYGFFVNYATTKNLVPSEYTVQSYASTVAVNAYVDGISPNTILDLCGAPGGKSIYLEELTNASIICCDIHPHRVELIEKYVKRIKSGVSACLCDARRIMPEWLDRFDLVVCDVPCSGSGDFKSKPDVMFNRTQTDIAKIVESQNAILNTAKMYVKKGGYLCYSTCSIFKKENDNVISEFLRNNDDFTKDAVGNSCDGFVRLLPSIDKGADGFFVARLRRK